MNAASILKGGYVDGRLIPYEDYVLRDSLVKERYYSLYRRGMFFLDNGMSFAYGNTIARVQEFFIENEYGSLPQKYLDRMNQLNGIYEEAMAEERKLKERKPTFWERLKRIFVTKAPWT